MARLPQPSASAPVFSRAFRSIQKQAMREAAYELAVTAVHAFHARAFAIFALRS